MCTYYETYKKTPHCTHDCNGCMFYEKSENDEDEINDEIVNIEFSAEELNMILKYLEISGATSVQNAIMNAISLALDYADDCK